MMKRLIAAVLLAAMLTAAAGCAVQERQPTGLPQVTEEPQPGESAAEETRIFTDDAGRQVEVPAKVSRIVPSGPLAQIVLFAIAPEMFVGIASRWDDCARGIIPDEYFNLPYLGQLYGSADLNVEELAAAGPELIIDIGEAKSSIVEDMDAMQAQTMIPSVHIETMLSGMPETFRRLGELLGKEEKGEELALFCQNVYARTQSIMEQVGDNRAQVLYILGGEGLNVLARGAYHAEVIDMLTDNAAVVDNPVGKGSGNEVTMEQISLWDPDYMIFAPGSIYAQVADMETWSELKAVKAGNYAETPEGPHNWMGMPPAVQRYLGLIWLPSVLYPEYCDYDVKADVTEYYRLFYNCSLSDEQYDALTANAFLKN